MAAAAAAARASGAIDAAAIPLRHLAALYLDGSWDEIRRLAQAAAGRPETYVLGYLALAEGAPDRAWAVVREQLPEGTATAPGEGHFARGLLVQRLATALALDAGDLPGARGWLAAHDRWLTWGAAVRGRAEGQLAWATYYRAAGDLRQARAHAERALALAAAPRQPLSLLATRRMLGELDTGDGHHVAAAAHHAAALALAGACAAPYEQALTLLALAELRATEGTREAAGRALGEAHALLKSLGAGSALARADALAAHLDSAEVALTLVQRGGDTSVVSRRGLCPGRST